MWRLMGKFKTNEWKEIDHLAPEDSQDLEGDKEYLEGEYRLTMGQGWMFKWIRD